MRTRTTQHDTFTIERHYPAAPARVFRAFADRDTKARWFGCVDGWDVAEHSLDFRVGGREVWRGGPPERFIATIPCITTSSTTSASSGPTP